MYWKPGGTGNRAVQEDRRRGVAALPRSRHANRGRPVQDPQRPVASGPGAATGGRRPRRRRSAPPGTLGGDHRGHGPPQTEASPVAEDDTTSYVGKAIGWRRPGPDWPQRDGVITHGGISGARLWVDREVGLAFAFAFLTNVWQAPEEGTVAILEEVYRSRDPTSMRRDAEGRRDG